MNAIEAHIDSELVDRLMELYCDWRTECAEVQGAYDRFSHASPAERSAAFAAYTAALDREESACACYAAQVRLLESRLRATGARAAA